jgi:hypothetical protein
MIRTLGTGLAAALRPARLAGAGVGVLVALATPAIAAAHQLDSTYTSRLPLAAYLAGAAMTVAMSFIFVLARDLRATVTPDNGRRLTVPGWLRGGLRTIGLLAWLWMVIQGVLGGSSDAEVTHLFLWVYGWVGIAMLSAFLGPIWTWLDPFTTLHDLGAWLLERTGVGGLEPAEYPGSLGRWPAAAGFAAFIWLELVLGGGDARTLFIVLLGYTAYTLVMMAQFGRETWRANGETFSVWFGLLGRIAPFAVEADERRLRRRGFGTGLLEPGWAIQDVVLIALGTGSILFDGLSQTQVWFDTFGRSSNLAQTLLLLGFLAIVVAAAFLAVRAVGIPATGAALLPIAVGYLVAHYLTYLLVDGQRIFVALADPFQQGWALLPTAFWEPTSAFLPPGLVWTAQLAAVVGGHMLGAWGGHVVAAREADCPASDDRKGRRAYAAAREARAARKAAAAGRGPGNQGPLGPRRDPRLREIPLAFVMVGLTTLTLWSLGQALVQAAPAS